MKYLDIPGALIASRLKGAPRVGRRTRPTAPWMHRQHRVGAVRTPGGARAEDVMLTEGAAGPFKKVPLHTPEGVTGASENWPTGARVLQLGTNGLR